MKKSFFRFLIGLGAPLAAAAGTWYLYRFGSPLHCTFYQLTGLYCIGCGSGRAARNILYGNWAMAFSQNPMLFLAGIPALCILGWEYLRFVFLPDRLRPVTIPDWLTILITAVLILFWILRNIPAFSFLAP